MSIKINPDKWKISLPMYPPSDGLMDNSTVQEYVRCATRGLLRYGLRRGFTGKSYPIQSGLAYHKYREVTEKIMLESGQTMTDEIHQTGFEACIVGWEDPPIDHKKYSFLTMDRLIRTITLARTRIETEQRTKSIQITRSEDSFDLELPFWLCSACGWASLENESEFCTNCRNDYTLKHPRHGGRVDQFAIFQERDFIRDFKTTGYMPYNYQDKFDPNAQMQGYVWAGSELAGRQFEGALIETVYNTKTKGPEITQHYVCYSKGQQERWLASQMIERQFIATMWSRVNELGYLAFPQNTDACSDFGGCAFRGACRVGGAWELEQWLENETISSHWDFSDPDKEESGI